MYFRFVLLEKEWIVCYDTRKYAHKAVRRKRGTAWSGNQKESIEV